VKFAAILISNALIPNAAVAGYFAHQEPGMPGFGTYAVEELGVRHVPGQDSDDWVAAAVTGPNKGGAMDLIQAYTNYPNHAALEASAQGKVKYYEVKCKNYSNTTDKKLLFTATTAIRKCSSVVKTRKQADRYISSLIQTTS
jgi:hypothetical protein